MLQIPRSAIRSIHNVTADAQAAFHILSKGEVSE
jgi:hypothetical protein